MKKLILLITIIIPLVSFPQVNTTAGHESLAQLARKVRPGFLLGSFASGGLTSPDGEVLQDLFRKEFNIITIGVYMKSTQPEPDIFRLENYDKLVDFATKNDIEIYLHPLIGGNQYTADWVNKGNHPANELRTIMRERITTILARHGDKIDYADVVNEALNGMDSAGNIIWKTEGHAWMNMGWYEGKKYKLPNYIVESFRIAREVGHKDLKLILNHPKNDTPGARLTEATWQLYHEMVYEGIPIDGIGFQMHIRLHADGTITDNHDYPWNAAGFETVLKRYQKAGINVHITEFDVHIQKQPASQEHLEIQARIYRDVLERAIKSPAVKTLKTWGFTDKYSWKERGLDGTPLLFDKSFNAKPAYKAQHDLLKEMLSKK